jgi:hypothetical protein
MLLPLRGPSREIKSEKLIFPALVYETRGERCAQQRFLKTLLRRSKARILTKIAHKGMKQCPTQRRQILKAKSKERKMLEVPFSEIFSNRYSGI